MDHNRSKLNSHHYHDALMEPPLGDEYPEDVIQKSTTQKYCSDLVRDKDWEVATETRKSYDIVFILSIW